MGKRWASPIDLSVAIDLSHGVQDVVHCGLTTTSNNIEELTLTTSVVIRNRVGAASVVNVMKSGRLCEEMGPEEPRLSEGWHCPVLSCALQ